VGLAIALNSALFSVMDGVLFRPLPLERPAELVAIDYRLQDGVVPPVAYLPELLERRLAIRDGLRGHLAASAQAGYAWVFHRATLAEMGGEATGVDSGFFGVIGLRPVLGRDFTSEDERAAEAASQGQDVPLPVIVGAALWERLEAGADPHGGVRELAGRTVRIVGVMGPGVKFPGETNIWFAVRADRPRPPAYGRLKPGGTVQQLAARYPDLEIRPLREAVRPGETRAIVLLSGAAGLLLLVAWVQVGGLVFSITLTRMQEIGVRFALGASRWRVLRAFILDNALLTGLAMVLAAVLLRPVAVVLVGMLPPELSRGQYLSPDLRTLGFLGAASFAGVLLLSFLQWELLRCAAPLQLLRGDVPGGSRVSPRLRQAVVATQITVTAFLLYLAGLTTHSLMRATTLEYGFDTQHVLVFAPPAVGGPASGDDLRARTATRDRLLDDSVAALRDLRGIRAVERVTRLPFQPDRHPSEVLALGGRPLGAPIAYRRTGAGPRFVQALGQQLIAGADFDHPDYRGVNDVAIINETLARRLAPGFVLGGIEVRPSLLEREIDVTGRERYRIVGIVRDTVQHTPAEPPEPELFYPMTTGGFIAIRTAPPVDLALPAVHVALEGVWGHVSPGQLGFLRDGLERALLPHRAQSLLLSLIALLCLPLAAVGLAGALLHFVRDRTRDTAIRIALGAEPAAVRCAVVRHALAPVVVGVAAGTAGGMLAARIVAHQLVQVQPVDPWTIGAVTLALLAVALGAAAVPARQAAATDPAVALRDA
jgi:putative ABC transport system permease protein